MGKITQQQRNAVKGQGFLSNKDGEHFSMRIITENGVLNAAQMKNLSEVAEKFGNGDISFTSRMTVELPGIKFDDIEKVKQYVAKENMVTGGTGAKVRPVVACKGTVCVFGLIDTQSLATEIHKRFYEGYFNVSLPHKFKIAVGGCPNNCVKPDLNDVGIVGQRIPVFNTDICKKCNTCSAELECPMNAGTFTQDNFCVDKEKCNNCGRCIEKCPFGAVIGETSQYKMYVGGRWGKEIRLGTPLSRLFSREEALDMIEKCILLFKSMGNPKERFGMMLDRIGVDKAEEILFSNQLLENKEEILKG